MITGIVIAKNEEKLIRRTLQTLSFCDEIILLDNNSSDKTADIARTFGAQVLNDDTVGDFSHLRNLAALRAKGTWIVYLDADEEITPDLRAHITHELQNPTADAYFLRRRDHFMGQILAHGEVSKVYERGIIRLVKKSTGSWVGKIHEEWNTEGKVSALDGFIEHYPHQDISEFLNHINRYSQIRAKELYESGIRTTAWEIIAYPIGKFVYTYIFKGGWKDKAPGFIYSFMMSFHSFLVRSSLFIHQLAHEN